MNAVVLERGQVTIPKNIRDRLGIGPKTVLDFQTEGGRLVAVKVTVTDPVAAAMGCLRLDQPTDELIAELRGEA